MFEIAEIKDVSGDADEYVVQMPIFEPDYLQSTRTAVGDWRRNPLAYALGDTVGMLTSSIAEQLVGPANLFTVAQVGGASEEGFARVELSRPGHQVSLFLDKSDVQGVQYGAHMALPVDLGAEVADQPIDDLSPRELVAPTVPSREILVRKRVLGFHSFTVEFIEDPLQSSIRVPIHVPLIRIHCPKNTGCAVSYSYTTTSQQTFKGTLTVVGSGGGGGKVLELTSGSGISTTDGRCVQEYVEGWLVIRFGRTLVNGAEVSYGSRVTVEIDEAERKHVQNEILGGSDDLCDTPKISGLPELFDESPHAVLVSRSRGVAQTTSGSFTIGIGNISNVPIQFSLSCEGSTTHEGKLSFDLAPGKRYKAHTARAVGSVPELTFPEVFWETRNT